MVDTTGLIMYLFERVEGDSNAQGQLVSINIWVEPKARALKLVYFTLADTVSMTLNRGCQTLFFNFLGD